MRKLFKALICLCFLTAAISCSKDESPAKVLGCANVWEISNKATVGDTVLFRIDTLDLKGGLLCGHNLDSIVAYKPKWQKDCYLNQLEYLYYVIKFKN